MGDVSPDKPFLVISWNADADYQLEGAAEEMEAWALYERAKSSFECVAILRHDGGATRAFHAHGDSTTILNNGKWLEQIALSVYGFPYSASTSARSVQASVGMGPDALIQAGHW